MPINRSIGVNLAFTADTKQAQQQLNNLQNTLTQLVNTAPSRGFSGFTKELQQATTAAATLKTQLSEATNVNTGKLDLGKFNQSLKASGMTLKMYKDQLTNLGPQGAAAFGQLSQAIMNAEMPLRRSSQLLSDFATTLKNTARWQISSSLLHGFMGSVQSAYYYAQDLNESLNNIRIVTGKNTDEMAQFAKEANAAAQALSTTTTAYTDASLIYYQQGLDDEQVKERTDVTIKMANVARESATEVSEQLTAVWNNFAKGGENLEYYADVMTALGAATASSSAEIAEGLEKFAAVADTVGLSYEYATSALATVTATTRQSADVVGNAFKTLFARIQGLNLGETLDDGTDLNKYSKALDAVGINIKKTNGDIKDMDTILNELGVKWKTLGKDQQMALAQTVAGVRQYTQLIALMDNWEFFQENLSTARGAEGTLQEQADTYAESWEAAQKRVKSAAESIYQDLLNDKFFIELNNNLAKLLELVDKFIKNIGGVKTILMVAGTALLKLYGTQLSKGINDAIYSLKMMTKAGRESLEETKKQANKYLQEFYQGADNPYDKAIGEAYKLQGQAQEKLIEQSKKLDDSQKKIAATLMDQHNILVQNTIEQAKQTKEASLQLQRSRGGLLRNNNNYQQADKKEKENAKFWTDTFSKESMKAGRFIGLQNNLFGDFSSDEIITSKSTQIIKENIQTIIEKFGVLNGTLENNRTMLQSTFGEVGGEALVKFYNTLKDIDFKNLTPEDIQKIKTELKNLGDASEEASNELSSLGKTAKEEAIAILQDEDAINQLGTESLETGVKVGQLDSNMLKTAQSSKNFGNRLKKLVSSMDITGQGVVNFAQGLSSVAMISSTLTSSIAAIEEGTFDVGQAFSALTVILPTVITMISSFNLATNIGLGLLTAAVTAIVAVTQARKKELQTQIDLNKERIEHINEIQEEIDSNKELYNSYNSLYTQYKENKISKEELFDVTDKICDKYNIENANLIKLTGNYDELTKAIKENRKAELERAITESKRESNSAKANILPTALLADDGGLARNSSVYRVGLDKGFNKEEEKQVEKYFYKNVTSAKVNTHIGGVGFEIDANDTEQMIKLYDELNKSVQEMEHQLDPVILNNSELYKEATNWLKTMKEAVEEYKNSLTDLQRYQVELAGMNLSSAESLSDFTKQVAIFREEVSKIEGITDVDETVNNYLALLNNEYSELYLGLEEFKKQLNEDAKKYIDNLSEEEKKYILSGSVDLQFVTTKEQLEKEIELSFKEIGTLDVSAPVRLSSSLAGGNKLKKADNEEIQALEQENSSIMAGFDDKSVLHQLDVIDEITQYRIEKNQEYLRDVEKVTKETIKLREEEKKSLEDNQDFKNLEAAEQRRDLTEEETERLKQYRNTLKDIEDELIELNRIKEEGLSWDEIENIGFDNLISGIEIVTNKAQTLQTAAELIGEGFTVAAEDVEKFSSLFPELLDNYTTLSDGSLQLNKETVEQNLEGIQAEIEARTQAKITEVDQQIALKEIEQKYLQEKLKNLELFLQGKQEEQKTVDAINKAGQEYESGLNEILGKENKDLTQLSIDNSKVEGMALIDMLNQVGAGFTAAAKAHYAMLEGFDPGEWSPLSFGSGTGSAKEYASNAGKDAIQLYEQASEKYEQIYNEAKQVQNQLDTVNGELDKLRQTKSVLESTSKAATHALDNVRAGKAGKDSSSKSKKDKEQKKLKEEFDRYWDIKKAIDAVDKALSRLDKDQEKLYGRELINSLKEENKLLEQQKANYEALVAAQRQEAAELQGLLSGYGVAFDASGAITNYAAATSAALAQYNDAIAKYNAGLLSDSEFSVYEKNFNEFKKAIDRYDNLFYTEMQETKDKLDDLWRQELANNLKAWEVNVQFKLDMKELKRGWNDFIKEIEEDFQKVYKDLRAGLKTLAADADTYIGQDGSIGTIVNAVRDVTAEIDKLRGGGSSDMFESISQAQEKLKELNGTLQDNARAMKQLWEDAWDSYLEGIDQVDSQFDDLIDRFEKINDELEFQKELIELLYGPEAYALMTKYYEGQQKNTLEQMSSIKQQADMWEKLWRDSGATMENQSDWTADQKKYYEQWQEAQSELNDLVLEYIRLLKDDYMNTVNDILKQLEKGITGSSLSDLETEWNRISADADKYYDSVEGAYEIQKLANKINESIAKTSDLKAQQKLQALREKEIKYLREKDNLTKYDLDAAEARYQIALKENALEEAKNNKTSMKLTRNEQGNWSYQYIADEEDTASKRQELLDAYSQLYQLASDAYESNLKALQDLQQQYLDSARKIYEDETLTEEERQRKLLELREWYLNQYKLLSEENTLYRNDLAEGASALLLEIYEQDKEAYDAMTEKERELLNSLIEAHVDGFMDLEDKLKNNYNEIGDKAKEVMTETRLDWTSGAQQIADTWNKDNGMSVKSQVVNAYERIMDANIRYQNLVDQCAIIVERDFSEEGIAGAIMRAEDETDNLRYKTEDLVYSSIPYLEELRSYVDTIGDAWRSVQDEIRDAISLIEEYLRYMGEANRAAVESIQAANRAAMESFSSAPVASKSSTINEVKGARQAQTTGWTDWMHAAPKASYSGSYQGNDSQMSAALGGTVNAGQKGQARISYSNTTETDDLWRKYGVRVFQGYATGGYTGEWENGSTDGRLALLHQKELVLNESDTSNFLSAITALRDMTSLNNSITGVIADSIANLIIGLSRKAVSGGTISTINNGGSNTANTFNITAEFPNAENMNEIKQAILTLPNIASQYIATNTK